MPRGSSSRSGPAPDPDALRRNRSNDAPWRVLPSEGRKGRAPAWPLTQRTRRELYWWNRLWKMPQAVVWEESEQVNEVALYVRVLIEAEKPQSPTNRLTLLRQMGDALGLTLPGQNVHRWKIEKSGAVAGKGRRKAQPKSSRDRLTVVRDED